MILTSTIFYRCRLLVIVDISLLHIFLYVIQLPLVRMSRLGKIEILLIIRKRDMENLEVKCHHVDIA